MAQFVHFLGRRVKPAIFIGGADAQHRSKRHLAGPARLRH